MRFPWQKLGGCWCVAVAALLGTSAWADLPVVRQSGEFRFAGASPALRWRVTDVSTARWTADLDDELQARTEDEGRTASWNRRVAVRLRSGQGLPRAALERLGLAVVAAPGPAGRVWVLEAGDPWSAAAAAVELDRQPEVEKSAPIMRRPRSLHGGYAAAPSDPYFPLQWHLQNRDTNGVSTGPDLNPRPAWGLTRGEGVIVGIGDEGFETDHPDLRENAAAGFHRDFVGGTSNAAVYGDHATLVAGLIAARDANRVGVSGLAPRARIASWTLFDSRSGFTSAATDQGFADMFRTENERVGVQNHSWGAGDERLFGPSLVEEDALDAALGSGRGGRGVVMVRSGGNNRDLASDANYDGYANDPRVIAVAGVRQDGLAVSYGNPGACLLVSAPTSDDDDTFKPTPGICTTDRVGTRGWNTGTYTNDFANYATNFNGTSASAPQITGIVALMLAANPDLAIRDVQQALALSSWQPDPSDPSIQTNGAGYRVSHNQGFGIPDAGVAVTLAAGWSNRPPVTVVAFTNTTVRSVPDDGLKVWIRATDGSERSISCLPAGGRHADDPTSVAPLVFVGLANGDVLPDLHGKAALIERGVNFFREKIAWAARAGAEFAVIYNNRDGTALLVPGGTDFSPIPTVLIGETDGRALAQRLGAGETLPAQIRLDSVSLAFAVTNQLSCEHVGLRVRTTHTRRADLRIVLRSPAGTRSVLESLGSDTEAGPDDWTFWSVQHLGESPVGTWTVSLADEQSGRVGSILEADLILRGVPIEDADGDGLDDRWERRWFGDLSAGPRDDPDRDGYANAREQLLGTDPTQENEPFRVELANYDHGRLRLRWPARDGVEYRVLRSGALDATPEAVTSRTGRFPQMEVVVPESGDPSQFFRVQASGAGE